MSYTSEIRRLRSALRRALSVLDGVLASTQGEQYAINGLISHIEKTLAPRQARSSSPAPGARDTDDGGAK